jgi:NADPH:quinone reductase-like Zn-dependent oxidoreductase
LRQTAIVADGSGNLVISSDVLLPDLEPDMLLVKTQAVAINPADVKLTGNMAAEGATAGNDCAGVVVAVGSDVQARFAVGDRICAAMVPMNPLAPRAGAFAQYAAVTADFALKVPDGLPIHQAAALGIGVATIGYALYRSLRIPGHPDRPAKKPVLVLVYGGSTASGTMAIQLIRRSV